MRIAWIATNLESADDFRKAGVVRSAAELTRAVLRRSRGHEIDLFVRESFHVPDDWGPARVRKTWNRYNRWMVALGGLATRGYDFLFSVAEAVPRYGSTPRGILLYDLFPLDHPEWYAPDKEPFYRASAGHAWRTCRAVTGISDDTLAAARRHFGERAGVTKTTPLGPGNPVGDPANAPRDPAVGPSPYLFTISTIEPRKNLGTLFEAFAALERKDVRLVVAGGKGWLYESALARIGELGIGDRVDLLGYVADDRLPGLYGHAEAYVCPSLTEGFGMPVLEAMLAGTPVVSSDAGALPEVGGDLVRYFSPTDVAGMARAIGEELADETRRERAAWAKVRAAEFTWDRCADLTLDAIEEAAR